MIRLRHITAALIALCVLVAVPATAEAYRWQDVVKECYNTGDLKTQYPKDVLKAARKHLPSDIREYSDCQDLINAALAALARGGNGNGNGNGGSGNGGTNPAIPVAPANPALTTESGAVAGRPEDLGALRRTIDPGTRPSAPPEVTIANRKISPTTGGLLSSARDPDANSLPMPLILSLAALAAMAALGALAVTRQRSPQIRAALRLLRR